MLHGQLAADLIVRPPNTHSRTRPKMSLSFHIDFNGQCEEAFGFYAERLGGRIGTMLRVKDSPVPTSSESQKEKIVHANICIDDVEWLAQT
jgi:uncharacterized glyoxalase superfamily protein PhnB